MKNKQWAAVLTCSMATLLLSAQQDSIADKNKQPGEPLEGMDCTWWNGGDRRSSATLAGKYFTPVVMLDVNYTNSSNHPVDNTVVGSTALSRNNEMQVNAGHIGGDFYYNGARAHIVTQFGMRSTVIPRNDFSPYRGQYRLSEAYRYLAEANAGYHIKKWYGINIDAGMFMSYIGLNSYYQVENWEYQASFTSDNTPWFFNGLRIQIFPTRLLKIETWLINGWQSYGMYNRQPGLGGNITWCPREHIKILTNDYFGADAAGIPQRRRFHSDNSVLLRYYNVKNSKGISRAAFSLTADLGFEKGGGVNAFKNDAVKGPAQYFASIMLYHRLWFAKNHFACTMGGGYMNNPGRYLVLMPAGQASPLPSAVNPLQAEGNFPFSANPGDQFEGFDCSANVEFLPNEQMAFRIEFVHRQSSVPYFAGRGGVTSQTGFTTAAPDPNWRPDLVKSENRIIVALLFRL